jgi:HSP20 family molecular chaperone IbpA
VLTWLPRLRLTPYTGRSAGRTSASTSTIWRGKTTATNDEPDPLDETLEDLAKSAQEDIEHALHGERKGEGRDLGELVERWSELTFVLLCPGCRAEELAVEIGRRDLSVKGPGFEVVRRLPNAVEPSSVRSSYANGVLSLRMRKTT